MLPYPLILRPSSLFYAERDTIPKEGCDAAKDGLTWQYNLVLEASPEVLQPRSPMLQHGFSMATLENITWPTPYAHAIVYQLICHEGCLLHETES